MFAGQNSERIGMLGELYENSSIIRDTFAEASEELDYDVAKICFSDDGSFLRKPSVSAPIILTANVASYRHISDQYMLKPALMAGHSLGEYGALACAGVWSFSDALMLVTHRAKLADRMAVEKSGVMTIIYHFPDSESERLCQSLRAQGKSVWVSCYNSHEQVTVSGKEEDVSELEWNVKNKGGAYKRLTGKSPFHCPLLKDITNEFAEILKSVETLPPSIPVISNYTVQPYTIDNVHENIIQHLISPVRWQETMLYMERQFVELLIELGSGTILSNLVNRSDEELQALSYEKNNTEINEMFVGKLVGQ